MTDDEELFDAYLDLALQGRAGTPEEFLAQHDGGRPLSPEALERLAAIHRAMGAGLGPRAADDRADAGAAGRGASGPATVDVAAGAVPPTDGPGEQSTSATLPDVALDELLRQASAATPTTEAGDLDPAAVAGRLAAGQVLGDYLLVRRLGGGGMGLVWLAEQRSLGRHVALKLIRPELLASATSIERFRREARAAARVVHPHAVALYEHGVIDGLAFMAMEWVDGEGLDERLDAARARGEQLPVADVARWGIQLAEALQVAHAAGLVHRDVKPSNVRLDTAGRARLLDFGVVRQMDTAGTTLTGAFAGSPPYAAPEQISGATEDIDARTDLYALGALLFECLTGRVPFHGAVSEQLFHRILVAEPPSPRSLRPDLPRDLSLVVLKCLEKRRAQRYASASALARDLEAVLELRPVAAQAPRLGRRLARWGRRHPAWAGVSVTALLALAILAGLRLVDARAAASQQRARVATLLLDARRVVDQHEQRSLQLEDWVRPALENRDALYAQWFPPEARREVEQGFADLERRERGRAQDFQAGLDALQLVDEVDAGSDPAVAEQTRRLRARHHANRWAHLRATSRGPELDVLAGLVTRYDREGRYDDLLHPRQSLVLAVDPPDAELFAFRFAPLSELVAGSAPRLVPVPLGDAALPVRPGTWALEVRVDRAPLRADDLLVAVAGHPVEGLVVARGGTGQLRRGERVLALDGTAVADLHDLRRRVAERSAELPLRLRVRCGAEQDEELSARDLAALGALTDAAGLAREAGTPLSVLRDGELLELVSPGGLSLRRTAAPLLLHPANRLVVGPGAALDLPDEPLLLLARHPQADRRRALVSLDAARRGVTTTIRLLPRGATPTGFLLIDPGTLTSALQVERPFFLAEAELTSGEYLEFLNDPATRDAVDASVDPVRFPRSVANQGSGGAWPRGADGRYRLPEGLLPELPITGISWDDASAYCAWRSARAAAAGQDLVFRLPTGDEWILASGGAAGRTYPFGDVFRSWWCKSCFSRPSAYLEAGLSFPVDESPYGAFDMAGSVQEWCRDWWVAASDRRRYAGGAWAYSNDGTHFRCWGANGGQSGVGYATVGLRLVCERPVLDELLP